jgi:hypothetical protein
VTLRHFTLRVEGQVTQVAQAAVCVTVQRDRAVDKQAAFLCQALPAFTSTLAIIHQVFITRSRPPRWPTRQISPVSAQMMLKDANVLHIASGMFPRALSTFVQCGM